jgi:hypothetical protein
VKEIIVQPVFTLAECACESCGFEFYQTLQTGHTIIDTLIIDKATNKLIPDSTPKTWLTEALLKALSRETQKKVKIHKINFHRHNRVVILNTLDYLYGHALLKLYNSIHHLDNHKNLGLIIIIPKSFEWLIPRGCAEVWVVDLNLNELTYFYSAIQKFVSKEFQRFDTIFLSGAYSHPEFTSININRFTSIEPFHIEDFLTLKPTFTFVLREDRWWWSGVIDYWFYRLCRKFGVLKLGSRVLSIRQNGLVKKTISLIRKKLPDARFYIVGLGTTGDFDGYAYDERTNRADNLVEKDWCRIYARSHVVIGVHGSNMLLPTAHAAGCVEILPEDRYGNMVQDISVRYSDRKQLYFYRFADQYASPKVVAKKVISIIENFEVFEKNMCYNIYSTKQTEQHASAQLRDDIYAIH